MLTADVIDPVKFSYQCWPDINLYDKQREILYSIRDDDETVVVAGNELGKDFIAAIGVLWFFCSRQPCNIMTTSVEGTQLEDVLWGEIRKRVETSKMQLPLLFNHLHIRYRREDGTFDPQSTIRGKVSRQGESLLGRHIPRGPNFLPMTMAVFDEASGISDETYNSTDTWAHRKLIVGNPLPCTNFFFRAVKAGDLNVMGV